MSCFDQLRSVAFVGRVVKGFLPLSTFYHRYIFEEDWRVKVFLDGCHSIEGAVDPRSLRVLLSGLAYQTLIEFFFIFSANSVLEECLSFDWLFFHGSVDYNSSVIERIVDFVLHSADPSSFWICMNTGNNRGRNVDAFIFLIEFFSWFLFWFSFDHDLAFSAFGKKVVNENVAVSCLLSSGLEDGLVHLNRELSAFAYELF